MSFFIADGKVWVRNYQIVDAGDGGSKEKKLVHQVGCLPFVIHFVLY
jgi:hypothetical protein